MFGLGGGLSAFSFVLNFEDDGWRLDLRWNLKKEFGS